SCETAAVEQCGDAVARMETGRPRGALHHAADLSARYERQLRLDLVCARDHQGVEVVDRRRTDGDADESIRSCARLDVFESHRLRPAQLADDPGFHRWKATSVEIPHVWRQPR